MSITLGFHDSPRLRPGKSKMVIRAFLVWLFFRNLRHCLITLNNFNGRRHSEKILPQPSVETNKKKNTTTFAGKGNFSMQRNFSVFWFLRYGVPVVQYGTRVDSTYSYTCLALSEPNPIEWNRNSEALGKFWPALGILIFWDCI